MVSSPTAVSVYTGFVGVAIEGQYTRVEDAKRRRDDHEKKCFRHGGQKTSFPEDPYVRFTSLEKEVSHLPFIIILTTASIFVNSCKL